MFVYFNLHKVSSLYITYTYWHKFLTNFIYIDEGCLEIIQLFWVSRKPVMWPWCNLAASQRIPYCASVSSHSPMGLVSRQWRIHNDRASRSASSRQCACPFYGSSAGFFGRTSRHPGLSAPLQLRFGPLWLLAFPRAKIAVERDEICGCNGHKAHKLSQQRLTAEWLDPRQSDCSQTQSKVYSDWMPSYIKATWPVRKIFKMAGYFPDRPWIQTASKGHSAPYSVGTRVSSSQGKVVAGGQKLTTHSHLVRK